MFYSLSYFVKQSDFSISFHDKNCKHIAATCPLWFLTSNKPAAQLFSGKLCVAKTFILRRSCDHTCGEEIQIIGLYGSEGTAEVGYVTFKIRRTGAKTGFAQIVELHIYYEQESGLGLIDSIIIS